MLAVELTGEQLSVSNLFGLILCLGGITGHVIYKYWKMTDDTGERIDTVDNNNYDMNSQFTTKLDNTKRVTVNGNANNGLSSTSNGKSVVIAYSNQKSPLLDYDGTDSDDDNDDMDSKSAEVLFDILKRRDERRQS